MRKNLKCKKCGIYFKDRENPDDKFLKDMCWNCRFLLECIGMAIESLGQFSKLRREVILNLDDVKIRKK